MVWLVFANPNFRRRCAGHAKGSDVMRRVIAGYWATMFATSLTLGSQTTTETQKLLPSDGAEYDYFGGSVSVSGDWVLIGSWLDDDGDNSGSAYVFARQTDGSWVQQQKLSASDGAAYKNFGGSVSLASDGNWTEQP